MLVLERETTFRDRVRGELVHPWGVAEARALGIYDLLKQTCGNEVTFVSNHTIGLPTAPPRDLVATTPYHLGSLCFYHPEMQEVLLEAAAHAYAAEHDRYSSSLHRLLDWLTRIFFEPGPKADALRTRVFARLAENPRRAPYIPGQGPGAPSDDDAYRNLFGED